MEHEKLQSRELEGTSFLQELGDVHGCSFYDDGHSLPSHSSGIEKNISRNIIQPAFNNTSPPRNYPTSSQVFTSGDHSQWRIDPASCVGAQPSPPSRRPQVCPWPTDRRSAGVQGYRSHGLSCEQQTPHQGVVDWQASSMHKPPSVNAHPASHYSAHIPSDSSPSGRMYTATLPPTKPFPDRPASRELTCDSNLDGTSCMPIPSRHVGNRNDCGNSLRIAEDQVRTHMNEGSSRVPHTYFDRQLAANSNVSTASEFIPAHQTSPKLIPQTSLKSSQGVYFSDVSESPQVANSPQNGSNHERPLQLLGRMVSKGCLEPITTEFDQDVPYGRPDAVGSNTAVSSSCIIRESQNSFVPTFSHNVSHSPPAATATEYKHTDVAEPPLPNPTKGEPSPCKITTSGIPLNNAPLSNAGSSLLDEVSLSGWPTYPEGGSISRNPSSCIRRPFLSGGSTLHYRNVDEENPLTQVNAAEGLIDRQSDVSFCSGQAEHQIKDGNVSLGGPGPSDVCTQVFSNGCSNYQTGQNYNPVTVVPDQIVRSMASMSPNLVSLGGNVAPTYSHSRGDDAKCNTVSLPDNSTSYPPILPKVPGVCPVTKDSFKDSPQKRQPMDRATRNERRRQQRLRKKQEAMMSPNSSASADANRSTEESKPNKRVKSRFQKKDSREKDSTSEHRGQPSRLDSIQNSSEHAGSESSVPCSPPSHTSNKRRRPPQREPDAKRSKQTRQRELKPKLDAMLVDSTPPCTNQDPKTGAHHIVPPSTEITQTSEPVKQVKTVKSRPPRPKKKRPLPTIIRKKKRSAFYGDDSDSEPDISGRLGGRSTETRSGNMNATQVEIKRRSERTAGDRKRYTVDLELNLSDDSDEVKDEEMAPLNSVGNTAVADENGFKVVESVLGRRVTKRVIKKPVQRKVTSPEGQPASNGSAVIKRINADEEEEEEEEEDVEEYYLKYKGYSYLHCEWRALDEIDDPRIRPKLRRFEMKQANSLQGEEEDVVLFNPDYVEVERVLDMKVYQNGELVTSEKTKRNGPRAASVESTELKRERERKRAQALREAKAKARAKAEAAFAASNAPSVESSSSCTQDEICTDEKTMQNANANMSVSESPTACDKDDTNQSNPQQNSLQKLDTDDGQFSDNISAKKSPENAFDSASSNGSDLGTPVQKRGLDVNVGHEKTTAESHEAESENESEQDECPASPISVTYYLVKWRSLAYEDATWELAQDVDPAKVKEFLKWQHPPKLPPVPRDSDYKIIRPDPSTWRPIESDKVYKNGNILRDYQLEGVNWLTYCWFHHRNCILADEMGLGKTVQSVTFLLELAKAGVPGPFLVIVPLSTVTNWQREFESWSDFNIIIYHGSSTSRHMIQQYEVFYKRRPSDTAFRHDVYRFNALVTTFEVLMTDIEFFGKIHWAAAVIDEAHRLKNKKCKLGEGLRYLDLDHRVLLTGTPLQNNVEELFGLLNFLEPDRFNCSSTFVAEYGDLKTEEQVENLKALLKPMMLRRLKEDVEKSLAPKEETIVEVELTNIQKKYYRAIMERNFAFLCKGSSSTNVPNLMNVMMELRKCCNHPFLIKGAEDAILADMREQNSSGEPLSEESQTFQALVYASGKLVLIHKLLPKLRAGGHKVLIFSQMIRVLDILEDYLIHQRFPFERIDGRIHGPLRQEAIDRFTADPDKFVFLLCTKAGGLGINLTAADVVIIYDSDWNPQNDLQAQARCHRIGQQKMVKVYRLITRNTYEREMFDRASLKLGLDKAVLQSMGSKEARQAQMSKKEIEELLKKGAYGALMDDDRAGEDFCEEDIDKILQSRARVVQLEQGEKNSTFSKATFSISDNRSDIAIDDPNFWQKWAKMAGVDETAGTLKDLIMKTPRQRRQTNRYSALLTNEPVAPSPPSYDISDLDDSATAQSSGDEHTASGVAGRSRFRRSRRHRRHSRNTNIAHRVSQTSLAGHSTSSPHNSRLIEPLDRADLFRVERCLLTWPWGHWKLGLATVPFKRAMDPSEFTYFACAVLSYAVRFLPSTADPRVKATIDELIKPGVWNLELPELAKRVAVATKKATLSLKNLDIISYENVSHTPVDSKTVAPDFSLTDHSTRDSPLPDDLNAVPKSNACGALTSEEKSESTDAASTELEKKVALPVSETQIIPPSSKQSSTPLSEETQFGSTEPNGAEDEKMESKNIPVSSISLKIDESEQKDQPTDVRKEVDSTVSPKSASFDPETLIHFESFRKHVQRGCARLLNRVAFLFFLECEVVGVERSVDFIAGRLAHTDFTGLAGSLPPLEAIDADLPVPWWDKCCDKCLLLGVLKHGWEKYSSMRLDPALCFWSRAVTMLEKQSEDDPSKSTEISINGNRVRSESPIHSKWSTASKVDTGDANKEKTSDEAMDDEDAGILADSINEQQTIDKDRMDEATAVNQLSKIKIDETESELTSTETGNEVLKESILTKIQFPAVADLNSRIRKLIGFFLRVKNQREMESFTKNNLLEEPDEGFTPPPVARFVERKAIKWTRREEADFYRVVSSFGVEFVPVEGSTDGHSKTPVERRYNWHNFRQLANLNRKSDDALTEYFQSFYRMCQRVCKRPLTDFSGPLSTAITTTTSGHSAQGDEVCVDAISEERATRCLSRIDLLARIRNDILPHPNLAERLKLCQRGSEVPSWWIPGKHDGELLRGAAKHGLARTDLNILSDPEFSFSRVTSLIRERLSRETAVADYPGDLSANQANRSNIAAVAAAAARAAADQLVSEDAAGNSSDQRIVAADKIDSLDDAGDSEEVKSRCPTPSVVSLVPSASSEECARNPEEEIQSIPPKDPSKVTADEQATGEMSNSNTDLVKNATPTQLSSDEKVSGKQTENSTHQVEEVKPNNSLDSVSNEWSVKFATNLATAWPKDRTIQHRLELICQAVERNEWPTPRRYIPTPATASIPLSEPNRALIESHMINFSTQPTLHMNPSPFLVGTSVTSRIIPGLGYVRPLNRQTPDARTVMSDLAARSENFPVIFQTPTMQENVIDVQSATEDVLNSSVDRTLCEDSKNVASSDPSVSLETIGSPEKQGCFTSSPYTSRLQTTVTTTASDSLRTGAYSEVLAGSTSTEDVSTFSRYPSMGSSTTTSSRGRGRGRGRSGRASSLFGPGRGLGRPRQSGSKRGGLSSSGKQSSSPSQSPVTDSGLLTSEDSTALSHAMPPPSRITSSSPHRTSTRGRKRKFDTKKGLTDPVVPALSDRTGRLTGKRDRIESNPASHSTNTRTTRGSYRGAQMSTDSDVWDVRVPVISLVDGSLIYGEKAPKRKSLEAWLEANPNYMPYSVEMEDRAIYSRVSSARGQDTHNMEALAYKHYLNSLIASATTGIQTPTPLTQIPTSIASAPNPASKANLVNQQQQYLQLQQQQQLLTALSAYSRHPAYASLVASALTSWQAAGFGGSSSGTLPVLPEAAVSTSSSLQSSSHTSTASNESSVAVRTRSVANRSITTPNRNTAEPTNATPEVSECFTSQSAAPSFLPTAATDSVVTSSSDTVTSVSSGMEAILSAAYKQATANLAYMYNPMAAVAAYSQMLLASSANPMSPEVAANSQSSLTGQQAALASLYTNYVLAAKQQQQLQPWDQQRPQQQQQLSALASAVASVCGGAGTLDTANLLTMLGPAKANQSDSSLSTTEASASTSAPVSDQNLPTPSSPVATDTSKSGLNSDLDQVTLASSASLDVEAKPSNKPSQPEHDSANSKETHTSGESNTDNIDHTSTALDLSK